VGEWEALARRAATQVIDHPLDPTRNFAPMATKVHYERVLHSIEHATANQGGELLTGGSAADREGFFVGRGCLGSSQQAPKPCPRDDYRISYGVAEG
jgi:acyl-CoA reductase-like NAD-dependent aldehyde dehydrogenase